MEHTQKVALVPQAMLEKLMRPQIFDSSEQILYSLDKAMKDILHDTSIPADIKLNKYNQALQSFIDKKKHHEKQEHRIKIANNTINDISKVEDGQLNTNNKQKTLDSDIIISAVSKPQQKKVSGMLSLLEKTPAFSWNDFGEIVVNGNKIEKSNIIDLVNFYSRTKTIKPNNYPVGYKVFGDILKQINIPKVYLTNKTTTYETDENTENNNQEPLGNIFSTPTGKLREPKLKTKSSSEKVNFKKRDQNEKPAKIKWQKY